MLERALRADPRRIIMGATVLPDGMSGPLDRPSPSRRILRPTTCAAVQRDQHYRQAALLREGENPLPDHPAGLAPEAAHLTGKAEAQQRCCEPTFIP